jgi:hypothetical protein
MRLTSLATGVLLAACVVLLAKSLEAPSIAAPAQTLWVAVNGQAGNDGSRERPLDLATALSSEGPAKPGATILLQGGTYHGKFLSTLTGTSDAPIIVRQAPGERATIDSAQAQGDALSIVGSHTWFWGFEITSSHPKRRSQETGSWPGDLHRGYGAVSRGPGTRFINLVVHDNANGLGLWSEAVDGQAYGNLVYHNGWEAEDRGHGHGIYTQNETGARLIADNIIFHQFSHGIHAFGSEKAHLDNITLEGNVVFNNGGIGSNPEYVRNLLLGGGRAAVNPRLQDNLTYFGAAKSAGENNVGYAAGCVNLWASGNYLVGGRPLVLGPCSSEMFAGNTFFGQTRETPPIEHGGNEYFTRPPAETRVFVRPNRCEPGRAHVVIYNWSGQSRVMVDLSAASLVSGEAFVVQDAQNFFGDPVAQGTYDERPVSIPMTGHHRAPPVGDVQPAADTAPQFAVFVVLQPAVSLKAGTSVPSGCTQSTNPETPAASPLGAFLNYFGL